MVPSRVTPVHVATCVLIIAFCFGVNSDSDRKTCDVRMWYLDLVMDGPLSGDLSEEKRTLKDKIEKMVNKYKKVGRADGMVDCSILAVYEDLLGADDNSQESQNTEETFTDDSPTQDDNKNLVDAAQAKDNDPTQVNQTFSGSKTQEDENSNSLSSDGATDDSSSSKQTSNMNVEDAFSENVNTDDIYDETDLDETDFGDEEEDGEESEGSKPEHQTHGEEQVQGTAAESNGFSNNNGDMNQNSNEATVVDNLNVKSEKETATVSDDDRSENDEKAGNEEDRNTERKEKHMDDENVLDPSNGYVTSSEEAKEDNGHKPKDIPEEQADDSPEEKATEEQSKESVEDSNSNAKDTDELQKVSDDEAGINTDVKSTDKQGSDSVEEPSSKERKEPSTKKKRVIEEYVFDPRRGYVKVLKEVDIETDEEDKDTDEVNIGTDEVDKDTLEQPDSDVQVHEGHERKSEVEKVETQGSSSINANEQDTTENTDVHTKEKTEQTREEGVDTSDTLSTLQTMKERCLRSDSCDVYCYYGLTMRQCLDHYPSGAFHGRESKEQSTEPESGTKIYDEGSGTTNEEQHSTDNVHVISHAEEHGQTTFDSDTFMEEFKSEDILKSDTQDTEAQNKEKQNSNRHEERMATKDNTGQSFNDFTADLHRFELRFQQRAAEYANKIQNLEIMLMKLENQLLGEQLNKQNSSSSFSKLENHILRLENELLKLNQSYAHLQSENDVLKSRQRKYLELGHDKSNKPDNSTKHYELITKQQSKISELASLLMNHSELFDRLQSKSQVLEVQNQALYQIVMNQTALLSNIMKKMHELSEENLRQRHETQELKTKLQMKTNSDRLLEKLDNLVSGTGITRNVVDDGKDEEKVTKPLTIFHFLPKSPDAVVFKKPWNCDGKRRSRFCLLFSLILSPCPPYSTIYWTKCPYFVKDITKHPDEQTDSNDEIKIDSVNTNNAEVILDSERNIQDRGLEQPTANGINVQIDLPPKKEPSSGTEAQEQPPIGNTQHTTEEVPSAVKDDTSERSGEQLNDQKGIPVTETPSSGANPGDNLNSDNNVHANNAATDDNFDSPTATKESVPASPPPEQAPAANPEQAPAANPEQTPVSTPQQAPTATPEQAPASTPEQTPAANPEQAPATTPEQAPAASPEQAPATSPEQAPAASPEQAPAATPEQAPATSPEQAPATSPEQAPAASPEQAPAASPEQAPATSPEQAPAATPEQAPATSPEQAPATSPEQAPATSPEQAPAAAPEDRKLLYTTTEKKPKDCYGYYLEGSKNNGMYKIYVVGLEKSLPVYCDMRGGGWTVVLKRNTGTADFYREWKDYKRGFGGLYSEHWIGNENLHYITNQEHYRLRVQLTDSDNEEVYAEYDTFWTDDESESYRLHIGGYSGTAGDGFDKHNNMKFSTKDVDNDLVTKELKDHDSSCAKRFHGGWWYYKCYMSNLTGQYYNKGIVPDKKFDGISWKPWKKPNISLKVAVMKIRPLSAED